MDDYRNKPCLIDDKLIKKCISQDFHSGKLYFALDADKQDLDCGRCTIPSFSLDENRVRLLTDEEIESHALSNPHVCPNCGYFETP
jgi:hypothetical protein